MTSPKPESAPAQRHIVVPWRGQRILAPVRNGFVVIEGDIVLGTAEEVEYRSRTGPGQTTRTKANVDGDTPFGSKSHALAYPAQLWPANPGPAAKVPYTIDANSISNADIAAAINEFNATFAGVIQWTPRAGEADYVEFALDPFNGSGGCISYVGRKLGPQQITGSIACNKATLLHEMGHAVGLLHEHQRSDAVGRLVFTPANVDLPNKLGNFGAPGSNFDLIGLYDFGSIMHYGRTTLSKNRLPVLDSVIPGIPFGEATTYSAGDIDTVKRLYGFTPASVTVTTHPAGLPIIVDGNPLTAPQTFAWALDSAHTIAVPAGFQSRASDAARYSFASWNDGQAQSHGITVTAGNGERTQPGANPGVTVYQAEYARYDEVNTATACGSGTVGVSPTLTTIGMKQYALDGTVLTVTALPSPGQVFWRWLGTFNAVPQGENPKRTLIDASLADIQPCFEATTPIYTVTAAFTNPAPPTSPANSELFGSFIDDPDKTGSGFQFLPQNFDALDGWTTGSVHEVLVEDPAAPVTTNAQYDWINWSDGGLAKHTLAALSGTGTVYTATFTPTYRGFATKDPECASNSLLPADQQYSDGTVVPFSVAANAGWEFVGWTDALTGQPTPTSLTVHDQFAVVARFNTTGTPLSIMSLSPSNTIVGGSNVPLQIDGTGFTPNSEVYIRSVLVTKSFMSPTRIDATLGSADLAAVGGITIAVLNRTAPLCFVFAEATLDVRNAAGPPNKIFENGFEDPPP